MDTQSMAESIHSTKCTHYETHDVDAEYLRLNEIEERLKDLEEKKLIVETIEENFGYFDDRKCSDMFMCQPTCTCQIWELYDGFDKFIRQAIEEIPYFFEWFLDFNTKIASVYYADLCV